MTKAQLTFLDMARFRITGRILTFGGGWPAILGAPMVVENFRGNLFKNLVVYC